MKITLSSLLLVGIMEMHRYSIVLQGGCGAYVINNVKHALAYSNDVILSTWKGCISREDLASIESLGVTVIEGVDPGSSAIAYVQHSTQKMLNVNRQLRGAWNGISVASNKYVIRTRTDVRLDYEKLFSIWKSSGKKFGAVNITTVCPRRAWGYPYLSHVSDWCHVGDSEMLMNRVNSPISEKELARDQVCVIRDMLWHSKLSAEQVISLVLSSSSMIHHLVNKPNFEHYTRLEIREHERVLGQFANISGSDVDLRSDKYRGLSGQWLNFDALDFSDNGIIKQAPIQLLLFGAGKIRSVLRENV